MAYLAHLGPDGVGQRLQDHLLAVSRITAAHASRIRLAEAGALIGLLHDLGKYSAAFQNYLKSVTASDDTESLERGSVDHSTAGAQYLWKSFKNSGSKESVVAELLALCIASHHSGLIDCLDPSGTDKLTARMEKADNSTHLQEVLPLIEPSVQQSLDRLLFAPITESISSFLRNICKNKDPDPILRFKVGLLVRFLFSCLIDADRTDTADSSQPDNASLRQHGSYTNWDQLAARLDAAMDRLPSNNAIDGLRKSVSQACREASLRPPGFFTLTVPTGGGKTLASLQFALNHAARQQMERIIFVSPYTSIIDQNAAVARRILETDGDPDSSVVLEHHSNLTPDKQTIGNKLLAENWDAPVVFTTAVQILEVLFGSGTRSARRMHRMVRSVLVFDEIQTLPVSCVHLFNNAMNFLVEQCGTTVLLCTATQPLLHNVDPAKGALHLTAESEIMPDVASLFVTLKRHAAIDERRPGGWSTQEVADLAIQETQRAGSCLVVVNTKKQAHEIFDRVRGIVDVPAFHLSTNMCPAHRLSTLSRIKSRLRKNLPTVCISTQLIEAGVDISFASAIRATAGLDSIAQTAGRCNRNGERTLGTVHIVNLTGDLPKALIDIRKAQEAGQRVLDENRTADSNRVDVSDPSLIQKYFNYYFYDRRYEMDYPVGPKDTGRDDTLLNMLGANKLAWASSSPKIYLRQSFMTAAKAFRAIDSNTQGILVPYNRHAKRIIADLCALHREAPPFRLLKLAQRFSVNVFPYDLERLKELQAVREVQRGTGIFHLDERYYSDDFGLDLEGSGEMEFLGV